MRSPPDGTSSGRVCHIARSVPAWRTLHANPVRGAVYEHGKAGLTGHEGQPLDEHFSEPPCACRRHAAVRRHARAVQGRGRHRARRDAADQPRVRHQARERGVRHVVGPVDAREVPQRHVAQAGRAAARSTTPSATSASTTTSRRSAAAGDHEDADRLPQYVDFVRTGTGAYGQALGPGCVFQVGADDRRPAPRRTSRGRATRRTSGTPRRSRRPAGIRRSASDSTDRRATKTDMYATRHDPWVYFHAIIDSPSCKTAVVPLNVLPTT